LTLSDFPTKVHNGQKPGKSWTSTADDALDVFDFSIVNAPASTGKERPEAIEFVLPKGPARQFAASEITNQQLIDKSVVSVNGVRIALNLQLAE